MIERIERADDQVPYKPCSQFGFPSYAVIWYSMASVLVLAFLCALPLVFGQFEPNVMNGRSAYVHLFEWKWTDVAQECERFLGPRGFGAIQISPPNEHRRVTDPFRPWWERYQPVSYKLDSRSGSEAQLRDMVRRCNAVGVRIYVDAIINHMAGGSGKGIAGSEFDSGTLQYRGVPYGPNDFTSRSECPSGDGSIGGNYHDAQIVRNCRLEGMPDLGIYKPYTQGKIREYMNKLIDIGVAGFRIDAAKHMWPAHLKELLGGLNNLNATVFPAGSRAYIYHEVIEQASEPIKAREYLDSGRVTEFGYGKALSGIVRKDDGQLLKNIKDLGELWGFLSGMRSVTFIDNHDNQRGHGGGGHILTFRDARNYKIANAVMLAHPYGFPQVMSSFGWEPFSANWIGPPSDSNGNTNDVSINSDGSCGGGWICEHRWRQIANMVGFRNAAGVGGLVHWWDNWANQVAFGRGTTGNTRAFIAINNEGYSMDATLDTGLPAGTYCDVISGDVKNNACTGRSVTVGADRKAHFKIENTWEDPMIAIHVNAKLDARIVPAAAA